MAIDNITIFNLSGDVLYCGNDRKYFRSIDFYIKHLLTQYSPTVFVIDSIQYIRVIRNNLHFVSFDLINQPPSICISHIFSIITAITDFCNGLSETIIRNNLIRVSEVIEEMLDKTSIKSYQIVSPMSTDFSITQIFKTNTETRGVYVEHIETLDSNGTIKGIINVKSSECLPLTIYLKYPDDVEFKGNNPMNGLLNIPLTFGSVRVLTYKLKRDIVAPFDVKIKIEKGDTYIKFNSTIKQRVIGKCWLVFNKPKYIESVRVIDGEGQIEDNNQNKQKIKWNIIGNGTIKFNYKEGIQPLTSDFPFVCVEFEAEKTIVSGISIIKMKLERNDIPIYLKQATKQGSWTIKIL
ncbi:hypothetical protein CL6EHI_122840 [Entamoeba histolytica]|uniref:Mu subunit n=2 Tax=Entamoeba histolytica TaxID=5759 RepID=A0A8U0WQ59_ENTH1|nr:hypothetical protein EHI_122840 [Entamoeba histolytica HM-1:IMSS]EAL48834.1 hypothetical protein EHI_122840 [Entamoeba histolytica HM-1:IMSS]BAE94795.1 mu subunit isoform b [Entamoeba histolytica]GAT96737.1 hypothetical protein CL6EHI_122840 [Entamoeba histolytica]|eukprot:XP_654220.1 hypothetical protein EHI_122840 [Entamoeba histolytica HM-1:IMSS]